MDFTFDRSEFEARYPEFKADDLDKYFDTAYCDLPLYYSSGCMDGCDNMPLAMMALAHILSLMTQMANGHNPIVGEKTSKSVDGVSVSYQQLQVYTRHDRFWDSSPYGRLFMSARSGCGYGAVFV